MNATVFGQIGPYTIERPIGQGGMASVFLARDTRTNATVALKVVHTGTDEEAREILEAEQRGADLQARFSRVSRYVPQVYESGFATDYFYIAMEYVTGEDLSQVIHRGPLAWERAVAITMQLCEFLEQADRFEAREPAAPGEDGERHGRVLLHNDLKPRNIRVMEGDEIKVLDFGAAKALSLSRKVTRNDFGSTAYLSPECLESGDRDLHTDAWALGVLLYEMIRGRQPFRAGDTRRLEQRIRSRHPPESIAGSCPRELEAVIAKLLAPYPADRYPNPAEIRADLARASTGETPQALLEGWPARTQDELPTRRTRDPIEDDVAPRREPDEPATRRTIRPADQPATVPMDPGAATPPPPAPEPAAASIAPPRKRRLRRVLIAFGLLLLLNESCVSSRANTLADRIPLEDFAGLESAWPRYEQLAGWSFMGWGVGRLEDALTSQTMVLAERVMANYRTPLPTVRENQWKGARDALLRAAALAPRDTTMRAALRYCEGHLHRINGEASKARGQDAQAQQEFTDAVVAFREAAALRSRWPDPFLGLARTFIYGLEDVDRGAQALAEAEKLGHHPSDRETTQLADGYRARGEMLSRTARTLSNMPQERDYLNRAADAFKEALKRYTTVPGFGIRETQRQLDRVEDRLSELSRFGGWPWE
jgi:serine/threonine protein kinase